MSERIFKMKEGTEFPKSFAGTELRFNVPDAPTSQEDWDAFLAGVKQYTDGAVTAHALFTSAFALDRQKDAKEQAKEAGMTPAKLQEWILGAGAKSEDKHLRGQGGTRKPSGKTAEKAAARGVIGEYESILNDPETPDSVKAVIQRRLDAAREKLAALNIATPAAATTQPETPAAKPKTGAKK